MTAQPLGPLLRAPEEWALGVEDLADFGVQFDPEQLALLEHAATSQVTALMVGFPSNPEVRYSGSPLFTMDDDGNEEIVALPYVVDLSPMYLAQVLANERVEHQRFPSVPGRMIDPSYTSEWGQRFDTGFALRAPSTHRLWNLWPISADEATDVLDGTRLWRENGYELLEAYYACEDGDMDPCAIVVISEGLPYDQHQHRHHVDSRGEVQITECADGEEWMYSFREGQFRLDHSGLLVPKPLPELRLSDPSLQATWERLRATSAMNTFRAISAIPERFRETVLQTERNYSPWLWSY